MDVIVKLIPSRQTRVHVTVRRPSWREFLNY